MNQNLLLIVAAALSAAIVAALAILGFEKVITGDQTLTAITSITSLALGALFVLLRSDAVGSGKGKAQ